MRTILFMLLLHLVADYTLQGWLADGKQKKWWAKCFGGDTPPRYRHDYIAALVCHALYWSSEGARAELAVALEHGLIVMVEGADA